VYIFCYINVEDTRTQTRIVIFYVVTLAENVLLVVLWTLSVKASLDFEKAERQNVIISGARPPRPVLDFYFIANYAYSVLTRDNMRQPDVAFCFMSGATPRQ
jgi:hypothetical protein